MDIKLIATVAVFLASCGGPEPVQPQKEEQPATSSNRPLAEPPTAASNVVAPPEPGTAGGLPDDRRPLNEGKLDLRGPEGAGQVVQHFAALLEQRRFAEARKSWGGNGVPEGSAALLGQLESYREVHAQIGKPGGMEGAAGSLYVTVPLVFYGRKADNSAFRLPTSATLRRVNDVPGSTEAQRSWHLEGLAVTEPKVG